MPVKPAPPITKIDFAGLGAIAAGATTAGTNRLHALGYNNFMLYCECNKDAIVYIDASEDHTTWYPIRDKDWSDVLVEHVNDTVGGAAATITPSGQLQSALIHNTHAANTLYVSFDGGTTWKAVSKDQSLSVPDNSYDYQVKGSAAGTTYEILNLYYIWGRMVKASTNAVYEFHAPGARYIRVRVKNLDGAAALDADISIKAME
jgi:hypothetical protein